MRQKLYDYMTAICRQNNCNPIIIGGIADHVHLLINLNKSVSLVHLIEKIKKYSSKWIKTLDPHDPILKKFYWQNGYGAFSVSQSNLTIVKNYIENQETHHRKFNFQDELRRLLTNHNISFDEKYIWD